MLIYPFLSFVGMLGNCLYEELLLQSTSRLLSADLHMQLAKELAINNKGFGPRASPAVRQAPACCCCREPLATVDSVQNDEAVLFRYTFGSLQLSLFYEKEKDLQPKIFKNFTSSLKVILLLLISRCGHSYHMKCIEQPPQCLKCDT